MARVRILMTGPSLSHRNQGDNLLYFVVGGIIRAHYGGDVEITAFSATSEPGRVIAQAPWLRIVNPRRQPLRALALLCRVDAYFIAGAIPFHDNLWLMLQQFGYALAIKLRGGRFIVNAVSVQPIVKPLCRRLFRWTARLADAFSVRDAGSAAHAEALGARAPVSRTVDPGMLCQAAPIDVVARLWHAENLPADVPVCGIGPHIFNNHSRYADARYDFSIEYQLYSDAELDAYYASMAVVADRLAERGPVVFFALSTRMPPGDDRVAAEWIIQRMRRPERAFVVRGEYAAAELMGLLGRLDLYVSTRLHGYALAVGAGVPTIAIEFHPKMRGLAQELGIEDWLMPLVGIDGAAVAGLAAQLLADLGTHRTRLAHNLQAATARATAQIVDLLPAPR